MGNIGWGEIALIAILGLLLFGPSKLPEMGKSLGNAIQEFKKAMNPGTPAPPAQPTVTPPPPTKSRTAARKPAKRG